MSWSRSSRVLAVILLAALLLGGVASAVDADASGAPDAAKVGSTVGAESTVEFEFTDLYSKYDSYTLVGTTDLGNATWTVVALNNQGDEISEKSGTVTGQEVRVQVSGNVAEVVVRLEGTVPRADNFTYQPAQTVTLASFVQTQQGGVSTPIETFEVRPYTENSQEARTALDEAATAIDESAQAGADVREATDTFEKAETAFDNRNFGLAVDLATEARNQAEAARQSSEQTSLLVMAGGGVLVLALLGAGGYWFLQRRDPGSKL